MKNMTQTVSEEYDESLRMILDPLPLPATFWDEGKPTYCNQSCLDMFGFSSQQEYIDSFPSLSPEYQPDGQLSRKKTEIMNQLVLEKGSNKFEWLHQRLDGEQIPAEITLIRLNYKGRPVLISYAQDLREEKRMLGVMREADERTRIMLDATPLCCNLWSADMVNIDCNQEAVNLFELNDKREYLDRFFELSSKYQPDGRLSSEKAAEMISTAFAEGRVVFEWMHRKFNGEPIPAEITLVRVKQRDEDIVAGYTRDLRELKKTVDRLGQLESLAFTDSGTGVYNRRYFMQRAERSIELNDSSEAPLAIIMMDLDKFKEINDTYGHLAGDEVLKEVAAATQSVLRPDDLLARYGGEEFVIMIQQSKPGIAEKLAERIRAAVSELEIDYEGNKLKITVSLGIALRKDHESVHQVIGHADECMYQAKQGGRNRVESIHPET